MAWSWEWFSSLSSGVSISMAVQVSDFYISNLKYLFLKYNNKEININIDWGRSIYKFTSKSILKHKHIINIRSKPYLYVSILGSFNSVLIVSQS